MCAQCRWGWAEVTQTRKRNKNIITLAEFCDTTANYAKNLFSGVGGALTPCMTSVTCWSSFFSCPQVTSQTQLWLFLGRVSVNVLEENDWHLWERAEGLILPSHGKVWQNGLAPSVSCGENTSISSPPGNQFIGSFPGVTLLGDVLHQNLCPNRGFRGRFKMLVGNPEATWIAIPKI